MTIMLTTIIATKKPKTLVMGLLLISGLCAKSGAKIINAFTKNGVIISLTRGLVNTFFGILFDFSFLGCLKQAIKEQKT